MRPPSDKLKVAITIDKKIHEKAMKIAKEENRPFSNFIETVLMKYFGEMK